MLTRPALTLTFDSALLLFFVQSELIISFVTGRYVFVCFLLLTTLTQKKKKKTENVVNQRNPVDLLLSTPNQRGKRPDCMGKVMFYWLGMDAICFRELLGGNRERANSLAISIWGVRETSSTLFQTKKPERRRRRREEIYAIRTETGPARRPFNFTHSARADPISGWTGNSGRVGVVGNIEDFWRARK